MSGGAGGGTQPWEPPLEGHLACRQLWVLLLSCKTSQAGSKPKPTWAGLLMAEMSISVCFGLMLTSGSWGQIQVWLKVSLDSVCGQWSLLLTCLLIITLWGHEHISSVFWPFSLAVCVCVCFPMGSLFRLHASFDETSCMFFAKLSHPALLHRCLYFSSFYVQPLICSHLTGDHFSEFWIKAIQYTWIFSLAIKPTGQNLRLVPWLEWNHIAVMAHFHRRDESVKTVTDGSLKFLNPHVIEIMLQIKHGFDSAKGQKCFYCLLYFPWRWLPNYMLSNNFIEKA